MKPTKLRTGIKERPVRGDLCSGRMGKAGADHVAQMNGPQPILNVILTHKVSALQITMVNMHGVVCAAARWSFGCRRENEDTRMLEESLSGQPRGGSAVVDMAQIRERRITHLRFKIGERPNSAFAGLDPERVGE